MAQVLADPLAHYQQGFGNALATGQQVQQMNRGNALADLYRTQGQGIASGDAQALNALAQLDPMAAMDVRRNMAADQRANRGLEMDERRLGFEEQRLGMAGESHEIGMKLNQQQLEEARAAGKRAIETHAAQMDEITRAREAEEINAALSSASAAYAQGPQAFDAWKQQNAAMLQAAEMDPAGVTFEAFPGIAAGLIGAKEGLLAGISAGQSLTSTGPTGKDRYTTVGGQLVDLYGEGGPAAVPGIDGRNPGMSIQLPDGTTITDGVPPGQNPQTTATPRDADKLSSKLSESDVEYLAAERDAARSAEDLQEMAKQIEMLADNVGYTGPFGSVYGAIDQAIGVLPGDEGSRGQLNKLSFDARATLMESMKGAITDAEQALIARANPGENQRPEANKAMAGLIRGGARRVETRAKFFEDWARRRGSLEGAEAAWDGFIADNPAFEMTEGGLRVLPPADYRPYLDRQTAADITPQGILSMDVTQLQDIELESLTDTQRAAYRARLQQLSEG